jgi:hypothetical protein
MIPSDTCFSSEGVMRRQYRRSASLRQWSLDEVEDGHLGARAQTDVTGTGTA